MYKVLRIKGLAVALCLALSVLGAIYVVSPIEVNGEAARNPYTIYLTFDDGPSAVTDKVLDVLLERNVPATFFVLGSETEKGTARYKRMMDEGHTIGIHSYTHEDEIYKNMENFKSDFERLEALIYDETWYLSHIYRMPGGTSTSKCPDWMLTGIKQYIGEKKYTLFDWDIDPKDSTAKTLDKEELFKNVVAEAEERPNKDLVILMHDDGLRTTLPEALPMIIDYFQERGYGFSSLYQGCDKGVD